MTTFAAPARNWCQLAGRRPSRRGSTVASENSRQIKPTAEKAEKKSMAAPGTRRSKKRTWLTNYETPDQTCYEIHKQQTGKGSTDENIRRYTHGGTQDVRNRKRHRKK